MHPNQLASLEASRSGPTLFSKLEMSMISFNLVLVLTVCLPGANFCRLSITFANTLDPEQA